tara:strand:+ start:282 stop:548 length:267 start_codon:yes stop_codon:yes gene_type:complete
MDVKVRLKKIADNVYGYDLIDILEFGFEHDGCLRSIVYMGWVDGHTDWSIETMFGADVDEIFEHYAPVHPKPSKLELLGHKPKSTETK